MPDKADTIQVAPDVVKALKIQSVPIRKAERHRTLSLGGALGLDANRLTRIHPRFGGEVVELGTVPEPSQGGADGQSGSRPLRFGDEVREGQLLAVLWSTALGEKKSEYVDALSQLRLERETLSRQETLLKDEAVPERNVREAKRAVEAAEIDVDRVERTLRSWRLTEAEIQEVKAEADRIRNRGQAPADNDRARSWARLEVHSPFGGTLVEKNIALGDIVETTTDLFKVADLHRLSVWAYIYEEDLPVLLALKGPIRWTVRVKSDPKSEPLGGTIEEIGDIIDPNQHTALVTGHVENRNGLLRAGQFITATIDLPPDPGEMEIPTSALVEDGDESIVFIQPDPQQPRYSLRHVSIMRHTQDVAYVRPDPAKGKQPPGPSTKDRGPDDFKPGDLVVSSGAIEFRATLRDLQRAAKAKD